jgi:hypothetical protein
MNQIIKADDVEGGISIHIPQEIADRLNLTHAGLVSIEEAGDRLIVTAVDEETARQIEVGRRVAKRHRDALALLAR